MVNIFHMFCDQFGDVIHSWWFIRIINVNIRSPMWTYLKYDFWKSEMGICVREGCKQLSYSGCSDSSPLFVVFFRSFSFILIFTRFSFFLSFLCVFYLVVSNWSLHSLLLSNTVRCFISLNRKLTPNFFLHKFKAITIYIRLSLIPTGPRFLTIG